MFENLEVFRMSNAMASHAGIRQAAVAQNIANADTPGYRARDVLLFQDIYEPADSAIRLRATRPGHLNAGQTAGFATIQFRENGASSPNENNVSLELEMLEAIEVKRQHERAVSIYKSALNVLRSSLGRG
ncbi:MAG: FlgB family protein [Paracoccaceae bacterium]